MRLEIRNIGKVRHADIAIDGITVIAAANNTGKSTLGKALYSLLSPFHNYDSNVRDRLVRSVFRAMSQMAPIAIKDSRSSTGVFLEETVSSRTMRVLAEKIVQEVQYGSERSEEDVSAGFLNIATQDDGECKKESLSQERWLRWDDLETISSAAKHFGEDEKYIVIRQRIAELLSVSDEQNAQIITQRTFETQFGEQIKGLFPSSGDESEIVFSDDQNRREVKFIDNRCVSSLPATNERRNIYILDDPSLIDNISVAHRRRPSSSWGPKYRDELIEAMLNRMEDLRSDIYDDLAGSVVAQEKMQEVLSVFDNAFHAVLAPSPSGLVINTDEKVKNPIQAGNASMGVKAFAIIRFLIENGIVSDDDILVLDEPEIHLHPEWQVTYAHALVLTAKTLNVKMLITTHSSYFLQALVDYAYILDYLDQTSVYTAESQDDGSSTFVQLDDAGIADTFDRMARPFLTLQKAVAEKDMKG